MDLYNYNKNNKRKFSKSIEQEENLKRKNTKNNQSIGCFKRCCTRKKQHEITSIENLPLESLKPSLPIQSTSIENISNGIMTNLKRSLLYNETAFCQKV